MRRRHATDDGDRRERFGMTGVGSIAEVDMSTHRSIPLMLGALFVLALVGAAAPAAAQGRQERDGVVLFWGLVPGEIAARQPSPMHGVDPALRGLRHLVVALFDAKGARIADATVQAQLREPGVVNAPTKSLSPMTVNGQASYGQYFEPVMSGPYHFHIRVTLPGRVDEIEFTVDAATVSARPRPE